MKSYRCLLEEWGRLLAAVRAGEVDFPILASYRVALENHLGNVRSARARQLRSRRRAGRPPGSSGRWCSPGCTR